MGPYSGELQTARTAAAAAAELINSYRQNLDFDIEYKGKNDLVTDADLEAEKTILGILSDAYPDDRFMAEESSQDQQMPEARTWLVDPVDGTINFAHGFPPYCVSIALWEGGEPAVGVVIEVNSGELFWAEKGEGAYLNDRQIRVSAISDPAGALIGTGFPYKDLGLMKNYLAFFEWLLHNTHGVRRAGSAAYDLGCIAAGRIDGFYEYSLSPWDLGAGVLLIQEAGGVLSDWEGGDEWLLGKRIVAGNRDIHRFLLEKLPDHFTEEQLQAVVSRNS